jgi:glycosyltransferase involved in cell wall biosynthesis
MSVSVVTPNFNNEPFLRACLESVIDDPAVDEIVIVDNASTDRSVEMIRSFQCPKIRLIQSTQNLGATLGRHRAITESRGEYICYLDGDDFLSAGSISAALEQARLHNLDMSIFQLTDVDADGLNPICSLRPPDKVIDGKAACAMTLGGWRIHPLGLIRRSVYDCAWEGFSPHGYSDDELLTRRIFLAARRVGGNSGDYFYRRLAKPPGQHRDHEVMMTALEVLRLGVTSQLDETSVRRQRNMVSRFMTGMVRRWLLGRAPYSDLQDYRRIMRQSAVAWRLPDLPYRLLDVLTGFIVRPSRSPE